MLHYGRKISSISPVHSATFLFCVIIIIKFLNIFKHLFYIVFLQWHPILTTLRSAVEQKSGHKFNSLLCNLYRDGKDSIGWHSDSELSLGPKPVIASLSLGDIRVFNLRKQPLPVCPFS